CGDLPGRPHPEPDAEVGKVIDRPARAGRGRPHELAEPSGPQGASHLPTAGSGEKRGEVFQQPTQALRIPQGCIVVDDTVPAHVLRMCQGDGKRAWYMSTDDQRGQPSNFEGGSQYLAIWLALADGRSVQNEVSVAVQPAQCFGEVERAPCIGKVPNRYLIQMVTRGCKRRVTTRRIFFVPPHGPTAK